MDSPAVFKIKRLRNRDGISMAHSVIAILGLSLLSLNVAIASASEKLKTSRPQNVATATLSIANEARPERPTVSEAAYLETLKEQLAISRSFQTDVFATVYWCLGVTVTIVLALLVFSWWSNFKIYERDKEALREEVRSVLSVQVEQKDQQLQRLILEERTRSTESTEALRSELRERIAQSVADERTAAHAEMQAVTTMIKDSVVTLRSSLMMSRTFLSLRITRLNVNLLLDAEKYSVAVTLGIQLLGESLDLEDFSSTKDSDFYFVRDSLESLEKAVDAGGWFNESEIEKLRQLLGRLPDALSSTRDRILPKVKLPEEKK